MGMGSFRCPATTQLGDQARIVGSNESIEGRNVLRKRRAVVDALHGVPKRFDDGGLGILFRQGILQGLYGARCGFAI